MKLVCPGGPVFFFNLILILASSLRLCRCRFEPHPEDRQWLRLFFIGESKKKSFSFCCECTSGRKHDEQVPLWPQRWLTFTRSLAVYLILFAVTCLFQTDVNRGANQLLVQRPNFPPPHSAGASDWDVWFSMAVSAGTTSASVTAPFSLYVNYLRSPGWKNKASLSLTWQCLV